MDKLIDSKRLFRYSHFMAATLPAQMFALFHPSLCHFIPGYPILHLGALQVVHASFFSGALQGGSGRGPTNITDKATNKQTEKNISANVFKCNVVVFLGCCESINGAVPKPPLQTLIELIGLNELRADLQA